MYTRKIIRKEVTKAEIFFPDGTLYVWQAKKNFSNKKVNSKLLAVEYLFEEYIDKERRAASASENYHLITPINNLCTRINNLFYRLRIKNIKHLSRQSKKEIIKMCGYGKTVIKTIDNFLQSYNYSLRE